MKILLLCSKIFIIISIWKLSR